MPGKVVQFNKIGTVTFSQNKRSKNIKISVKPDKSVLVSFPFFVSSREVAAFVSKNEDWIVAQQQKFDKKQVKYYDGFSIKTKLYTIILHENQVNNKNYRKVNGNKIDVFVEDFSNEISKLLIEDTLIDVYRFEAKRILPKRLAELAEKFGFGYNKVTIRNNKRNWGSCSSGNNISLNLQMMKLPDFLIDYILLHELVHTEIKNHGPKFWRRLNEITENKARELAKQVKQFSTYHL